jgi:hypothetical protein
MNRLIINIQSPGNIGQHKYLKYAAFILHMAIRSSSKINKFSKFKNHIISNAGIIRVKLKEIADLNKLYIYRF